MRRHKLNYPFDPAKVSDPRCWLTVTEGAALQTQFITRIRAIQYAPRYNGRDQVLELTMNH